MAAYSTASLLLCQQQFEANDLTPDCFGRANSSVFRYDHLSLENLSLEGDAETIMIKTEDGQQALKVSYSNLQYVIMNLNALFVFKVVSTLNRKTLTV